MIQHDAIETPIDFEKMRHYQLLKLECCRVAFQAYPTPEVKRSDAALELAKLLFQSITKDRWGSEQVGTELDEIERLQGENARLEELLAAVGYGKNSAFKSSQP